MDRESKTSIIIHVPGEKSSEQGREPAYNLKSHTLVLDLELNQYHSGDRPLDYHWATHAPLYSTGSNIVKHDL